jgi:hypothetical protein
MRFGEITIAHRIISDGELRTDIVRADISVKAFVQRRDAPRQQRHLAS